MYQSGRDSDSLDSESGLRGSRSQAGLLSRYDDHLRVVMQRWGILPESTRHAIYELALSPSEIPVTAER